MIGAHVEFHIRRGPVTELANLVVQIRAFVHFNYVDFQIVSTIRSIGASVTLFVLLPFMHFLYVLLQPLLENENFSTGLTGKLLSIVHVSPTQGNL